ncbi:MGMT family protein [Desulfovibrio sp. JC010]|uniref:MGMT family protein n=1 Tax=Desulfovibrio sp. JC010 TaxID=2593641 RepID=UPI0013D15D20|nr:DNA methyltransferase [Desulfovibrio sp. JC010]
MGRTVFTEKVIEVIKAIPEGKICSYGKVAAMAGNSRGARQVVRILHTSSQKEGLPWQRVVNREGCISLKKGQGYERQRELLEREGVVFELDGHIDIETYLWTGEFYE